MCLLVKLIPNDATESMVVFFRFMVSTFWVVSVLTYKRSCGKQFQIRTKHHGMHILRGVSGFISVFSFIYALRYAPLVHVKSLSMTYTLFIPILSSIFLGTKTNFRSWLALIWGFIGVIFILKPYGDSFNPMALIALISAFAIAVSFLGVHELAKDDNPYTIMLYYFPLVFILSGIFALFDWKTPCTMTLINLFAIGVLGTIYQELITRALLYVQPTIVSPLLYLSLILNGFFDWMFWSYIPDLYFFIGIFLVVLGCWFSIKYSPPQESNLPA